MSEVSMPIGYYARKPVSFAPYDPRAPTVARRVAALIQAVMPELSVEHIGSTAVKDCPGKGIVDLMVLYPSGMLAQARDTLDSLGFQRQDSGVLFPESRPMRVGSYRFGRKIFRLHAHVLEDSCEELSSLRLFRDQLLADRDAMLAYAAAKRALVASGVTDPLAYTRRKSAFIEALLAHALADTRRAAPAIAPVPPSVTEVAG